MSSEHNTLVSKFITSLHVEMIMTKHMIGNAEFNATKPLRDFLSQTGIFEFLNLQSATMVKLPCRIYSHGKFHETRVRFGYPPHKKEARSWVENLKSFVKAEESIFWCIIDSQLTIVPSNQLDHDTYKVKTSNPNSKSAKGRDYSLKKIDYLKQLKRNQEIGLAGEVFVLEQEKSKLIKKGRPDLANLVEHVSVTKGDGLGYDILSFDVDGDLLCIEVKTTTLGLHTPAFMTRSELDYSKAFPSEYRLFRVFEFNEENKQGKVKVFKDPLERVFSFNVQGYQIQPL